MPGGHEEAKLGKGGVGVGHWEDEDGTECCWGKTEAMEFYRLCFFPYSDRLEMEAEEVEVGACVFLRWGGGCTTSTTAGLVMVAAG